MELTSIKTIKELCRQYNIWPSKKMGQNFLINKGVLTKIVQAADLNKGDIILEIGPGFGVLTQELLKHTRQVLAIEKDKRMAKFLTTNKKQLTINKGLKIINDDILKIDTSCLLPAIGYKLIANLPYQITSPVLWKFLQEEKNKPSLMVLMIQKEVAERIVAQPGAMSILSVMCQFYADCKIVSLVKRENFWPQPEVDSAVVRLKIRPHGWLQSPDWSQLVASSQRGSSQETGANIVREKNFFKLVKIGFSTKRKMLKNNLAKGLGLSSKEIIEILQKSQIKADIRAQELSIEQWIKIFDKI